MDVWYSSYISYHPNAPSLPKHGEQRDSSPEQDEPARSNQGAEPNATTYKSTTATARDREYGSVAGVKAEEKNGESSARKRSERRLEVEERWAWV